MLAFALTALVVLVAASIALAWAWGVKAPVRMACIRAGVGGRKVTIDRGAIVMPGLHQISGSRWRPSRWTSSRRIAAAWPAGAAAAARGRWAA